MPQFSVYKNKNPQTRVLYPYLVDVQSDLLGGLSTRVVVPLVKQTALKKKSIRDLTPIVRVEGQGMLMLIPQLAGVPASSLGAPIASLAEYRSDIVAALDFLITGV